MYIVHALDIVQTLFCIQLCHIFIRLWDKMKDWENFFFPCWTEVCVSCRLFNRCPCFFFFFFYVWHLLYLGSNITHCTIYSLTIRCKKQCSVGTAGSLASLFSHFLFIFVHANPSKNEVCMKKMKRKCVPSPLVVLVHCRLNDVCLHLTSVWNSLWETSCLHKLAACKYVYVVWTTFFFVCLFLFFSPACWGSAAWCLGCMRVPPQIWLFF